MVNPELEVIRGYGGKLLFNSGDMSYSLAELLRSESDYITSMSFPRHEEFMRRHDFTFSSLQNIIHGFSRLRIMVLGEIIVDEYINCNPLGMSQEEPSLVVSP
ncbi:MAG: ADP-heptose synthase, partial [Desulfobacterales bacterium]